MTVLKYLKKLFKVRVRSSLLCCGIPLEKATRYVGIADVVSGMIYFAIVFLHWNEVQDGVPRNQQTLSFCLANLPNWLALAILTSHAVKFFLGIVIYMGAVMRSRAVCRFWLLTSVFASLFAFPTNLFHIYEMIVVNQFSHEIHNESRGASAALGSQTNQKLDLGHTILPEGMDAYIPTGENNNTIEGKYIGFGNTTFPGAQISTIENHLDMFDPPQPPPEVPAALLPLGVPSPLISRSPSLYQIEIMDDGVYYDPEEDTESANEVGDDATDVSIHSEYEPVPVTVCSSRFHGLIPTVPPSPLPQLPPLKTNKLPAMAVIPILVVTPTESEHKINHI